MLFYPENFCLPWFDLGFDQTLSSAVLQTSQIYFGLPHWQLGKLNYLITMHSYMVIVQVLIQCNIKRNVWITILQL